MIVRVDVVLNRTVVVDSDWRFDNLIVCSSHLQSQKRALAPTTATAAKTSLLKWIRVFSNFSSFIPVRLKCQRWANFPGVDCLGTAPKFRKRKKNSSSLVYVFHKTWNYAFSRRSRAEKAKKCTKKCDARANVLAVCLTSLLLFWTVLAAVAFAVVKAP